MKLYDSLMKTGVVVIVDLVGSRHSPDRARAQQQLEHALTQTNQLVPHREPLQPTVGDESQGVYDDLPAALIATLVLRLALPENMDCRFGVGYGTYQHVSRSSYGTQQDGPAWWSARDAIDEAKKRETRRNPSLRTWFLAEDSTVAAQPELVNAYLLTRDHIVSSMDERSRAILWELVKNPETTLTEIAAQQNISPSAISQRTKNDGIDSIIAGIRQLESWANA